MRLSNSRLLLPTLLILITATGPMLAASAPTQIEQAIAEQRKLAEASPQDPGLWNDLGNLLWTNHEEDAAAKAYKQALAADPSSAAAHYNLGLLLAGEGQIKEALAHFQAVLKTEPKSAWAHFQVGAIYQRRGQRDKAVAEYAEAFRLNPNLSFADVNPQVVANPLVTEALMRAFEHASGANLAPRTYSDPGHIAGLFLPPTPSAPAATAPAESAKRGMAKSGTAEVPAQIGPEGKAPSQEAPVETGRKVHELTPESLHPNVKGGAAQETPKSQEPGGVRRPIIVPQIVVPSTPAQPRANGKTETPGKTKAPGQPQAPAQGGSGQRQPQTPPGSTPVTPSTGRLDLHLVNDPAPAG